MCRSLLLDFVHFLNYEIKTPQKPDSAFVIRWGRGGGVGRTVNLPFGFLAEIASDAVYYWTPMPFLS
jgi:hypothetical protein